MATRHAALDTFLRTVERVADTRSDARLLADFYAHRDEAAFATLVRRHQRAVWSVCARVLTDPADAEDAFQATFLVLARSGKLLADRGGVGGWLYRVAGRVARKARTMTINRKRYERQAGRPEALTERTADDLFEVVSAELDQLSEAHRLAVIVCDLDGLSRTDAAARLGWNEGTLSARLHRGRKELAERLRARGVSAPLVGLAAVFATSTVPARAADAVAELACVVVESGLACRAVPASVAALVSQTTKEMAMRITTKVLATLTLAAGVLGFGWLGLPGGTEPKATAAPVPEVKKEATPEVPASALQLLRNRKVHRELNLTADQRVTIADHFDDQFEAAANRGPLVVFAPGQPRNPQAEKQQIEAKVKELQDAEAADTKALAAKLLKPSQLSRLAEIELQAGGAVALLDPKVADALKLTDDQKTTISGAISAVRVEAAKPKPGQSVEVDPRNPGPKPKPYSQLDAGQRKAAFDEAAKCLSKEQLAAWKRMTGEPVSTFDPYTLGGRGGSVNSGIQFRGDR